MGLIEIIVLALLQGLTEFLPVSSSGHLILLPNLTGLEDQGLVIDVAVHVGTLGAVTLFFRDDVARAMRGLIDLVSGNVQGFLEVFFLDQPQKLTRPGHIGSLAHIDKIAVRIQHKRLKPRKLQEFGSLLFHDLILFHRLILFRDVITFHPTNLAHDPTFSGLTFRGSYRLASSAMAVM